MISKNKIKSYLNKSVSSNPVILGIDKTSFGHSAGNIFEEWTFNNLKSKDSNFEIWRPNEFLNLAVQQNNGNSITKSLTQTWWADLHFNSKIKDVINYDRTQQDGADLLLHYGDTKTILTNMNNVILINVKSHNADKDGRDPNILSAYRLLKFLNGVLHNKNPQKNLNRISYWIIGFSYKYDKIIKQTKITEVNVKDLFLLDVDSMPNINFDSAIQIQWHPSKMSEIHNQSKKQFVDKLVDKFDHAWIKHKTSKDERFNTLLGDIKGFLDTI
ncbi:MAG: HincII family type II restriction endonuclease [Candidatus Nitrosoabyssus spongiisocia]|nr:MAG: HincII family type II restriction endonuclease [Nitrosopumilaceae archaeon AB1(1)]